MTSPQGPDPEATFSVWTRPWVPVVGTDGASTTVGLRELVATAHRLRRIAGESPTMTAALHRLVLALLHRVYGPPTDEAWHELWLAEAFPTAELDRYGSEFAAAFDLFDAERPFLQSKALRALAPATPAKLVPYRAVGNNVTLFDHTTSADVIELSPADAARWLVTVHAYDPGGMKTPFAKDKSSERALGNNFGMVLVEGGTLRETLLLNLLVYAPEPGSDDAPAWERPQSPPGTPGPARRSHGWTELLTWPSRRVVLHPAVRDGAVVVTGVAITPGERLKVDLPLEEKLAAFRTPRDAKGRLKRSDGLQAVRLDRRRGVWRHSVELLVVDTREEGRSRQRPPALDQIDRFDEVVPASTVYTLRVFGQRLDSKASVIEAWSEESVSAPVALLRARDVRLGAMLGTAIALADNAGSAVRALQTGFRTDMRAKAAGDLDTAYWPSLQRPFDDLLRNLGAARTGGTPEIVPLRAWADAVVRLARDSVDQWSRGSLQEGRALLALGRHHNEFNRRLIAERTTFLNKMTRYPGPDEENDG
ncbi:type I-E CRISPR-associated protein Cse1/CasA [Actinokineospora spheciospongiae]|uniref:type I-E CRISPR-associated protein Cse1/CasA n=1 Tax=Actinokineospora spheciospongiae TaxID=909613 RepID=UPI000D710A06|nr:type I-E CRISPR-associated protein Cse1/CasA [Actinokineospora spheciospongiae]PWW58345.1 CRISPR system Cascade subunit CasA [Actinokineospora spheciospongiae]